MPNPDPLTPAERGLRVLSLGAGVQSSTLLLMACEGELQIDAAIFADTQWEPRAVYDHLAWLEGRAQAAGIPVHRVTAGNLRAAALAGDPRAWIPLHARRADGTQNQLRRQCTTNYKIAVIKRQLRVLGAGPKHPVTVLKGISLDEAIRMKDSDVRYIAHEYPLIDRRMTRVDCLRWLERHGYPRPPKSACIGCPYHNTAGWQAIRADPEAWADALAFEASTQHRAPPGEQVFLHFRAVPLASVDLRSEQERGQLELFGEECAGVCGV